MSREERVVIGAAVLLAAVGILVGSLTSQSALAGGLIALAPVLVIAYQSVQTRRAVEASTSEAEASRQLVEETRRDRELAVRPFVTLGSRSRSGPEGHSFPLRNTGRGSASQIR